MKDPIKTNCENCGGEGECHTSHSWTCHDCNGFGYLINGTAYKSPNGDDVYRAQAFAKWELTGENTGDSKKYKLKQKEWAAERRETKRLGRVGRIEIKKLKKKLSSMGYPFRFNSYGGLEINPIEVAQAKNL